MHTVDRVFITIGAISGFLAVGAGAFGAHSLRDRLSADMQQVFETGVTYQMYHALALIAVGVLLGRFSVDGSTWLTAGGWLFVAGSILFSGSLYLLSLSGTTCAASAFMRRRRRITRSVVRAVAAARRAFETGPWSRVSPAARQRLVWSLADLLERHADEFAELEALDNGKPVTNARRDDIGGGVGRAVVDDDDLEQRGWIVLVERALNRIGDVALVVVGRDQRRDGRQLMHRPPPPRHGGARAAGRRRRTRAARSAAPARRPGPC